MTILNEYIHEYVVTHIVWKSYSWVGIILGLIILFIGIWLMLDYDCDAAACGFVIGICFVIIFFIFFVSEKKVPVTRYEVILNDEITFNEFNDKYKLIEERGDILVIEEKNDEKS